MRKTWIRTGELQLRLNTFRVGSNHSRHQFESELEMIGRRAARVLRLMVIACSVGLGATPALGLTDAQRKQCASVTPDEIIRTAAAVLIESGKQNRAAGLADAENPWPFSSYDELRSKYPDCCSTSREHRGDYDPALKAHLEGGKEFPVFIVTISLPSVMKTELGLKGYQYSGRFIVTCYGEILDEDDLLSRRK